MLALAWAVAHTAIARTTEWVSPWDLELVQLYDDCAELCGNWTALYHSDTGCKGDDMVTEDTPKFCPDMEQVEAWTVDDEATYVALHHRADDMLDSELDIFERMSFERMMKLSVHPWQKFQVEKVRSLMERRRKQASATSMRCMGMGPNIGKRTKLFNEGNPKKVSLQFQEENGEKIISYFELKTSSGKMKGGTPDVGTSKKKKLPDCTTVVLGREDGEHINALNFISQGKETRLMGDDINDSVVLVAPRGKCLGDMRMRYDEFVNRLCFKFNIDE